MEKTLQATTLFRVKGLRFGDLASRLNMEKKMAATTLFRVQE